MAAFDSDEFHARHRTGGKKYKINPCVICGWSKHMGIHNPNNFDMKGLWINWAHCYQNK